MSEKNDNLKTLTSRISQLEKKVKTQEKFERVLKLLAVCGAIVTFSWGLYQYFHTKQTEFRRTFWEKQYELYSSATASAAKIALAEDLADVEEERAEFWELYWGRLSMIENRSVHDAMVNFGENLNQLEEVPHMANGLRQLSYLLSRACRQSLKDTWEPVPLDDIPEKTVWSKDNYSKE